MIPEEDRGPAWLRDYGFTDFGDIAADIHAMSEYAQRLTADVAANYSPHSDGVTSAMMTSLPAPHAGFTELVSFNQAHDSVRDATQDNIYFFGQGSTVLATAAERISEDYRHSDAFAHATVRDVDETMTSGDITTALGGGA